MKKIFIPLAAGLFTLGLASCTSCSDDKKGNHDGEEGKGGVYMGGVMRMNEVEAFKSLNPIAVNENVGFHIGCQLFEGLVKFDQNDLSIKSAIARDWSPNADQTEWTFHIRQDVKFHNDACFPDGKGRTVTANDIKLCFDKLCTNDPNNAQFDVTFKDRVVGANESFEASKGGKSLAVSGVKVVNDTTLVITLKSPFAGFLNILAMPGCWVYPKEALDKYGLDLRVHPVGTGPFYMETVKEGEVLIMKKNQDYYGLDKDGNRLPYLDGLKYTFIREKKAEILEFKSGNLDMVYRLPVEIIPEILGDLEHAKDRKTEFQILNSTAFNTNYLGFNTTSEAFNKKEVRLAFNHAIDRHKIADFTIQGEGNSADYGIVPYVDAFEKDGYDFKGLKGYTFDVAKAKEYLKKAGYPDGKGFPKVTLQINSGGGNNILIAEVVQKMLKENLNVDIDINTVPFAEHIEQVQAGKIDFFRFAWVADYPDPETFLTIFYGKHVPANASEKSFINYTRFKNARFDSLFAASFTEPDKAKRYAMLSKAEQVLLDEAPFMPIFYDENFRLEQLNVRNFPENAMNYMDLSVVYLIPKDKMNKK
ncbi:MAG: ABC transporter substrate-binding protein [Bacteroidota bacterium]